MKKVPVFCVLFFISFLLYAQTGYKDYQFGITVEQLKLINPDIKESEHYRLTFPPIVDVMFAFYTPEAESYIPNPNPYKGKCVEYSTKDDDLTFYFDTNKLVAVVTYFKGSQGILSELIKRYGEGNLLLVYGKFVFVWADYERKRFITFEEDNEKVIYIDAEWASNLCKKTIEEDRKRTKKQETVKESSAADLNKLD